jgi:two-component system response regulator PilR (NtrC family)
LRVLVVDDEVSMREYLELLLSKEGYQVQSAQSQEEAQSKLAADAWDLVISDMKLGKGSGMEVLKAARASSSNPEVILITAFSTPEAAVSAMRAGAYDYIRKPFDNDELLLLARNALEKRGLKTENQELKRSLGKAQGLWVGESPKMREVFALVDKVAAARSTVLVVGESGTGKELVARAIHLRGANAAAAFVPINCAALNEGVLESELFGHVKGSFTGASGDRTGLLVSAGDGTVFLDEVAEVPPPTQVKLLRVLQERKVKPVGSTVEVPFQARIVAATNKPLEAEVRAGRFREDLYYRLNVITLELPPLRERAQDIPLLAEQFLGRMREELGRPNLAFQPATLDLMKRYRFPGNVRQLQNIVERAATLAEGEALGVEALPAAVRGEPEAAATAVALGPGFSLEHYLDDMERRYLLTALQQSGGVKSRAAELLGLSFRSFRYRLAKLGLGEDAPEGPR